MKKAAKPCAGCGSPLTDKNSHSREQTRRTGQCRPCLAKKAKDYRLKNRDNLNSQRRRYYHSVPDKWRDTFLKRKYGLSLADWERMFNAQGRKCAICEDIETPGRGWQTDHCHTTGRVRGILCHHCNSLIGHAKESKRIMLKAVEYISCEEKF